MTLNRERVADLLNTHFDGNFNRFARTINIDPSHLHRFIRKGIGGGKKLIGGIMDFCKRHNLKFEEFITL